MMPRALRGMRARSIALMLLLCCGARLASAAPEDAQLADTSKPALPIGSTLDLQVELHRRGFSCGSIDGVMGLQTEAALRAFQRGAGIAETGQLDAATREHLPLSAPALGSYTFTAIELAGVHPVPKTWLEKSQASALGYGSALELAAEKFHTNYNTGMWMFNSGIVNAASFSDYSDAGTPNSGPRSWQPSVLPGIRQQQ